MSICQQDTLPTDDSTMTVRLIVDLPTDSLPNHANLTRRVREGEHALGGRLGQVKVRNK